MRRAWEMDENGTVRVSRWRLNCIWYWRRFRAKVRYRDLRY